MITHKRNVERSKMRKYKKARARLGNSEGENVTSQLCEWKTTKMLAQELENKKLWECPYLPTIGVVGTIAKLAKSCVLRITTNKLYFILQERAVNGGVAIWCELNQGHFFNEYAMDGVSEEANEIFLELCPDNLMKALRTATSAKSVKIKLTKKVAPALTFEVEQPSLSAGSRVVVHDVPVVVVPRRLWHEFDEPNMPDFDVSIYLPPLRQLKNVVERMKNLSNFVTVSASQQGEFNLTVDTDMVTVSTHFKDLENPQWSRESQRDREREESAEARIDIRKFAQFLVGQQVNPQKVICNLVDSQVAHFFLLHEDVSLQYFMPVSHS